MGKAEVLLELVEALKHMEQAVELGEEEDMEDTGLRLRYLRDKTVKAVQRVGEDIAGGEDGGDAEALEELAKALHHTEVAGEKAESESVQGTVERAFDHVSDAVHQSVDQVGEQD